jgi:hypothetical protein
VIVGNRPEALPEPMSLLDSPFRSGTGSTGTGGRFAAYSGLSADEAVGEAVAVGVGVGVEVTATASAAAGGVHFAVVAMLAVAVSFTELTELAFDATAIWAFREAGSFTVTELRVHEAVPSPLGQPLVNSGFWLDGCAVSFTDTFETDPPTVETSTT